MKILITTIALFFSNAVLAQDYFVIIKKNDNVTYNYPENVTINLRDDKGHKTRIEKDDAIDVIGNYTLKIDVPWSEQQDIINSDGGRLEIFKLPTDISGKTKLDSPYITETGSKDKNLDNQPKLIRREVFNSETKPGEFDLLITFDNNLTLRIFDGKARAWQNNEEIKVTNSYLVQTPNGLLKISFDPKDGETWWVWEL